MTDLSRWIICCDTLPEFNLKPIDFKFSNRYVSSTPRIDTNNVKLPDTPLP